MIIGNENYYGIKPRRGDIFNPVTLNILTGRRMIFYIY